MEETTLSSVEGTPFYLDSTQQNNVNDLSDRVRTLRSGGRLTADILQKIRKYFRIKNIYHSNAIEGNRLGIGETRMVVEQGLTLSGESLKDQAEARNLAAALDLLEQLGTTQTKRISENDVRQLHSFVLKGIDDDNAGRYRTSEVVISGSKFKPTPFYNIAPQMEEFSRWLYEIATKTPTLGDPSAITHAAVAHTWFVQIHPFIDGNGRVARLLMNLILMRSGYPVAIITREDRDRYYDAIEVSQEGDLSPFVSLLSECVQESLEEYESAVQAKQQEAEWAQSLVDRFEAKERVTLANQFEVWRSAVDLLKAHFRQAASIVNDVGQFCRVYFKDFDTLPYEKYIALRAGESAKRTWFFRLDFVSGDLSARYLFFFGTPSYRMHDVTRDVTLHLARETPPNSYYYERADKLPTISLPDVVEIGYAMSEENFIVQLKSATTEIRTIENITRSLFDNIISLHFHAR